MRLEVKKIIFVGLQRYKEPFFQAVQSFGKIQFCDKEELTSNEIEEAVKVLKILSKFEVEPKGGFTPDVIKAVVKLNEEQEQIKHALRQIKEESTHIMPFGDFDLESVRTLEKEARLKARFYASKERLEKGFLITSQKGTHYYFSFDDLPANEIKIERSLKELAKVENELLLKQKEIEIKLRAYAAHTFEIEKYLLDQKNRLQLSGALDRVDHPFEKLFTCKGWIPASHLDEANQIALRFNIHMEEAIPDSNETIPTYLENHSWGKVGEDLVDIFDTPSNSDKDPSYWVLFGFALFFAFIIGDGGYGAVFLGLLLFLKYKNPNVKGVQKRLLNLGLLLSGACIVWGILTHAFFSLSFDVDSPFRKLSLITHLAEMKADYVLKTKAFQYAAWMKELPQALSGRDIIIGSSGILSTLSDHVLLELSLFIGVLHMLTGMFRYLLRNVQLIGWILFLIGSYLYLPYFLQTPSLIHYALHVPYEEGATVGLWLISLGVPLSVLIAVYKHGITGIFEVMNGIGIFSDALSYLRLYALALAGSIVSATINSASAELPLVFAILLIAVAHVINMGLGIMGGVIHGLRLNFLEWYHYSFEGGGKKFKPLALID